MRQMRCCGDAAAMLDDIRLALRTLPRTRDYALARRVRHCRDAVERRTHRESEADTDTQAFPPSMILVRTGTDPDAVAPHVIETIRQLAPNRPIDHEETLEELRDDSVAPQRLNAVLIGLFALLALAIATVGVAGVLAFSVSQRTNELGIRLALGAEQRTIHRMILGEGAAMAGTGLAVGGIAAVPLSRFLSGLLFGVAPTDGLTIAAAAVLRFVVALFAAWIPARTATSVDPMIALLVQ